MEEGSPWSNLGSSLGSGFKELAEQMEKLEALIHATQRDFLTSIEALKRRLDRIEDGKPLESVYDVMTQDEVKDLTGVEVGLKDEEEDDTVFVVKSGFTAPPPEQRVVDVDTDVIDVKPEELYPEDGNSLSIDEEFAAINKVAELVDEEHPDLLKEEVTEGESGASWGDGEDLSLSLGKVTEYIDEHGGVVNQYLKRFDLVPPECDSGFRKELSVMLEDAGYQVHKVNRVRHFYCAGDVDAAEQYEKVYG